MARINSLAFPMDVPAVDTAHVQTGDPALLLVRHIARSRGVRRVNRAVASATGSLATSEAKSTPIVIDGMTFARSKTDLVLSITGDRGAVETIGVSVKQCNNASPTNAQLYFTTASGFVSLLRSGGISVSLSGLKALRQFCGDKGFSPVDAADLPANRKADIRRYFWEEIDAAGRTEWETLFYVKQEKISRLLLQNAYADDPLPPQFLLHKTRKAATWNPDSGSHLLD